MLRRGGFGYGNGPSNLNSEGKERLSRSRAEERSAEREMIDHDAAGEKEKLEGDLCVWTDLVNDSDHTINWQ